MSVVVKLTLVLQRQSCVKCASRTSTSPAHSGIHENCVCLLFCKDKTNGLSATKQLCHLLTPWS